MVLTSLREASAFETKARAPAVKALSRKRGRIMVCDDNNQRVRSALPYHRGRRQSIQFRHAYVEQKLPN
jgi:hypothetical protein